ncbi:galactose oxidase-like domain-containing protein [Kribbella sp. HUAS MG21]|uniref:Galactose oxidase-like domain-containing protein n=1 Tax=Kribbella sp. HUAS MG21 TaxID=3160966 RepID=A0AAU7TEC0_9ACTN
MRSLFTRARTAVAVAVPLVVVLGVSVPVSAHGEPPAAGTAEPHAHPTPHDHDSAEHAAEDLVGVPIREIERAAKAKADEVQRQTGKRPGRRSPQEQAVADARAAAADPAVAGAWSGVVEAPLVPVFTAMLPNGKVLMWDSVGDGPAETYSDQSFTRAAVWDPVTNTSKRVDVQGYNIFCAGYAQLSDGTVLVAGGNRDSSLNGHRKTHLFDWRTETWRRGPDMAAERWYPSVTALPNQEALILGGGPENAEVHQTNQWIRLLTGFTTPSSRLYPMLTSRPDGNVDLLGPDPVVRTLRTSAAGAQAGTSVRDLIYRDYASFATIGVGRTLVAGGGNVSEEGKVSVPSRSAVIVNSNGPTLTQPTGSMAVGRRQHNLTVLADGDALATGGMSDVISDGGVNLNSPVYDAELYDTETGTWRTLGAANRVRQYHSTSLLLPDGRVMTGGGGICGECQRVGYLEKNIEYFSPPYLYGADGQPAARPTITTAPASAPYASTFPVTTPQAASIAKVGLVGLGAPTHGDDQGQRYVPLNFSASGTTLTVSSPADVNQAPPGYYMLFVVDSNGVPSVARMVQLTATAPPAPAPVRLTISGPGDRCLDIDHSSTVPGTKIQLWDCNGTQAQRWTRPGDGTLRALGVCADVPGGNLKVGAPIRTDVCSSTDPAQKWTIGSDGRIRSATKTKLCFTAPGRTNAEQVTLANCNGSVTQVFRY